MPDNFDPLPVAKGPQTLYLLPGMANRHGLITEHGTENRYPRFWLKFLKIGVPIFMADIRDLSG
jgi:hypothetical protein